MDQGHPLCPAKDNYHTRKIEGYATFFPGCDGGRVRFEGTTHYLYQRTALEVISELGARVIVVLRKPSDRVYSSFQFTRESLGRISKGLSFGRYVDALMSGNYHVIDQHCSHPASRYVLKRDLDYGLYANYLSEWRERLGRERLLVCLAEQLRKQPREEMQRIARFAGLVPEFYEDFVFEPQNRTVLVRSRQLHRAARRVAAYLPGGAIHEALKRLYAGLMYGGAPARAGDDQVALARLERYYEPYNRRLAHEMQMDLSLWGVTA